MPKEYVIHEHVSTSHLEQLSQEVRELIQVLKEKKQATRVKQLTEKIRNLFVPGVKDELRVAERLLYISEQLAHFESEELIEGDHEQIVKIKTSVEQAIKEFAGDQITGETAEQAVHDRIVASKWNKYIREQTGFLTKLSDFAINARLRQLIYQDYTLENFSGNWSEYPKTEHSLHLLSLLCPESLRTGNSTAKDIRRELAAYYAVVESKGEVVAVAERAKASWQAYALKRNAGHVLEQFDPSRDVILLQSDRFQQVRNRHGSTPALASLTAAGFYNRKNQGAAVIIDADKIGSTAYAEELISHELGHAVRDERDSELPLRIIDEGVVESTNREVLRTQSPETWSYTQQTADQIYVEEKSLTKSLVYEPEDLCFMSRGEQIDQLLQALQRAYPKTKVTSQQQLLKFHADCEKLAQQVRTIRRTTRDFEEMKKLYTALNTKWLVRFIPMR